MEFGESVTRLLISARNGNREAHGQLLANIHSELRQIAMMLMKSERPSHTLQPSALVNEAYLRMKNQEVFENAQNRRYLFATTNRIMRQILVDNARAKQSKKRGGDADRLEFDVIIDGLQSEHDLNYLDLESALMRLGEESPRQLEVVELKFFSGQKAAEIANLIGCSQRTVENDWKLARAKLYHWLSVES